jgi:hypothetical protein
MTGSAATINWSVSMVMESGTPVSMGLAWLMVGADSSATQAAILSGSFNPAGSSPITNGSASGKLTAATSKGEYAYLVMTFEDKYSISGVITTKVPGTISFSGADWQTVPEPEGLLIAGILVLLCKRKRRIYERQTRPVQGANPDAVRREDAQRYEGHRYQG